MYLTRLHLDPCSRKTILALNNFNFFHGAIERSRVGEKSRILWRIDSVNGQYYLLILSQERLETKRLEQQFGFLDEPAQAKEYDLIFTYLLPGSKWRFRLCANPTRSVSNGSRGKITAHVSQFYELDWLKQKGLAHGFSIDEEVTQVTGSRWVNFKKKTKDEVSIKQVAFEGVLTVEDPDVFRQALCDGVGRGKAYGMGLLTIAPIRS